MTGFIVGGDLNNPKEKREIYFLNDKQNFPYNVPLHKVSPPGGYKGEKLNRICKWIKSSRDGEKLGVSGAGAYYLHTVDP